MSIAVGERVLRTFADGVFFVALDVVRDATLVPSLIAQALGVRETAQQSPLEATKGYLADRELLLVLDNVEQVLDAAAVVDELLVAAPRLRVLVTSRVPLRLYGEQLYPVPPLALPDPERSITTADLSDLASVQLFLERARAVRRDFSITEDNARAIASICLRLDGLPLAIELAAARVGVFEPAAILSLLETGLGVLSADTRNRTGRQQSLRGAMAWSVELLEERERALFRQLAVFYGGFTLDEVVVVAALGAEGVAAVVDGITSLVDASLLRSVRDGAGSARFGMIQTIHEYALEQLAASGEQDAVARRHALHFMDVAEEAAPHLNRPDQAQWFERLAQSNGNMRAALSWTEASGDIEVGLRTATALWRHWQRSGHVREGREAFRRLFAAAEAGSTPVDARVRAGALSAAGSLAYWQAELQEAETLYRQALEIDRAAGDRARIGDDYYNLGFVAMASRDFVAGRESLGRAAAEFQALGDRIRLGEVSGPIGVVELQAGNLDAALTWLGQAREVIEELGDRARLADNTMVLGIVHRRRGDTTTAAQYARDSVVLNREIGDQSRLALAIEGVAAVAFVAGDVRRGVVLAGAAGKIRETLGGVVRPFWDSIDQSLAEARAELGPGGFAAALAEGEAMNVEQAAELALA